MVPKGRNTAKCRFSFRRHAKWQVRAKFAEITSNTIIKFVKGLRTYLWILFHEIEDICQLVNIGSMGDNQDADALRLVLGFKNNSIIHLFYQLNGPQFGLLFTFWLHIIF